MLKRYLLAPGPTPVPPEVLLSMAMPIIHHRSPDFLPVLDSDEIVLEWGYAVNPDIIEEKLKKNKDIKGVFVQASETSTGVYHDIQRLASIVKGYGNTLLVVDAISALAP